MDAAIRLENVSKTFHVRERSSDSIRDKLLHLFQGGGGGERSIRALRGISLDIKKGENFGIIGRNGSGKSTLLKLIIGAYRPDKGGRVAVGGKVIRLALGMGFDPELSARDNIYVNASILGLTFKQIGRKFDGIVAFAELDSFVDTQLKYYSSGMVSRLAFAVAVHAEADIFLMDEFFGGVGDEGFREKSEKMFRESFVEGRTIVYVSHQLETVRQYCDRVLLLDMGEPVALGKPEEVLDEYRKIFQPEEALDWHRVAFQPEGAGSASSKPPVRLPSLKRCPACGASDFDYRETLWKELAEEWQLSEFETGYISKQQGFHCGSCGSNLRSMALAHAMVQYFGFQGTLAEFVRSEEAQSKKVLEINEAGSLNPFLKQVPQHTLAAYPQVDMMDMPFESGAFDVVVHSDTLEHVADPAKALAECRRVLRAGGVLFFTIPVVVGRMTRSRAGLPKSYHGDPGALAEDFLVHTEFGCDMWTRLFDAGFDNVRIHAVDYPSATVLTAEKNEGAAAGGGGQEAAKDQSAEAGRYDQDGLRSIHNHEFMEDPAFVEAYERGVQAVQADYRWHWRVHVGLWAARTASALAGDFVECGVNKGFLSSAIMQHLDWDSLGKTFFLMDTFSGLDERHVTGEEVREGVLEKNQKLLEDGWYTTDFEEVKRNFSQWKNVRLIRGAIPRTLAEVQSDRICFLHLDMNCAPPEVAAMNYFWDKLVQGAIVLLDDYAYFGYRNQKLAMDEFAAARNIKIASLPTGQGLVLKT